MSRIPVFILMITLTSVTLFAPRAFAASERARFYLKVTIPAIPGVNAPPFADDQAAARRPPVDANADYTETSRRAERDGREVFLKTLVVR